MKKIISIIFCAIFLGAAIYLTYANVNVYSGSGIGFGAKVENLEKLQTTCSDAISVCDYVSGKNAGTELEKPEVENKSFTISTSSNVTLKSDSVSVTTVQNITMYITDSSIFASVNSVRKLSNVTEYISYDIYLSTENTFVRVNSYDANIIGGEEADIKEVSDSRVMYNKYIGKWVDKSDAPTGLAINEIITEQEFILDGISTIIEDNSEYFVNRGLKKELSAADDSLEGMFSKISVDFSDKSSVKVVLTEDYQSGTTNYTGTITSTINDINNTQVLFLKNTKIYTKAEIGMGDE